MFSHSDFPIFLRKTNPKAILGPLQKRFSPAVHADIALLCRVKRAFQFYAEVGAGWYDHCPLELLSTTSSFLEMEQQRLGRPPSSSAAFQRVITGETQCLPSVLQHSLVASTPPPPFFFVFTFGSILILWTKNRLKILKWRLLPGDHLVPIQCS